MWFLNLFPFLLQAIVIGLDEFYFHIKRDLPLWERIGHPLDTLTVLSCFLFIFWVPFSFTALYFYIGLATFSCIFVTKDEFVHTEYCSAPENWLHALLFTLHPITLTLLGCMWPVIQQHEVPLWMQKWLTTPFHLQLILQGQCTFMFVFFIYQIVYWNFIRKSKVHD